MPPTRSARSRIVTSPSPRRPLGADACAVVLHLEPQTARRSLCSRTHARLRAGVARHVVHRFLQHAIDVNRGHLVEPRRRAGALVGDLHAELPFHGRKIPLHGAVEAELVEQRRVKCLRQPADAVEGGLRDFARSRAGRRRAASPAAVFLVARPSIVPIAVSSWPNSSCSSREISCSVPSRAVRICCASSRRCSESSASRANRRRFERIR